MSEQQYVASNSNTMPTGIDVKDQLDVDLCDASSSMVKNPKLLEHEKNASDAKRQYRIAKKNIKIEQQRDKKKLKLAAPSPASEHEMSVNQFSCTSGTDCEYQMIGPYNPDYDENLTVDENVRKVGSLKHGASLGPPIAPCSSNEALAVTTLPELTESESYSESSDDESSDDEEARACPLRAMAPPPPPTYDEFHAPPPPPISQYDEHMKRQHANESNPESLKASASELVMKKTHRTKKTKETKAKAADLKQSMLTAMTISALTGHMDADPTVIGNGKKKVVQKPNPPNPALKYFNEEIMRIKSPGVPLMDKAKLLKLTRAKGETYEDDSGDDNERFQGANGSTDLSRAGVSIMENTKGSNMCSCCKRCTASEKICSEYNEDGTRHKIYSKEITLALTKSDPTHQEPKADTNQGSLRTLCIICVAKALSETGIMDKEGMMPVLQALLSEESIALIGDDGDPINERNWATSAKATCAGKRYSEDSRAASKSSLLWTIKSTASKMINVAMNDPDEFEKCATDMSELNRNLGAATDKMLSQASDYISYLGCGNYIMYGCNACGIYVIDPKDFYRFVKNWTGQYADASTAGYWSCCLCGVKYQDLGYRLVASIYGGEDGRAMFAFMGGCPEKEMTVQQRLDFTYIEQMFELFKKCQLLKQVRGHEVTAASVSQAIAKINSKSTKELQKTCKTITMTSCDPGALYRGWTLYTLDARTSVTGKGTRDTVIDLKSKFGDDWKTKIPTLSMPELQAVADVILSFSDLQSGYDSIAKSQQATTRWENGGDIKNPKYSKNLKMMDELKANQARVQKRVLDQIEWKEKYIPWIDDDATKWSDATATGWSADHQWGSSTSSRSWEQSTWSSKKRDSPDDGWSTSSWTPFDTRYKRSR